MDPDPRRSSSATADRLDIDIRLEHLHDLFVLPETNVFSEYRNWQTGMEYAISETKGRWRRRPVRLTLRVPPDQLGSAEHGHVQRAIQRFCANRMRFNQNEMRAQHRDGTGALGVGAIILFVGIFAAKFLREHFTAPLATDFLADGVILVVAWVGAWYPLDTLVYANRVYRMENRALAALSEAEVVIVPSG